MKRVETSSGDGSVEGGRAPPVHLKGLRPYPLKVNKDSLNIGAPPRAPRTVIIHPVSPKIIQVNASEFRSTVIRLTGCTSPAPPLVSYTSDETASGESISPAARLAVQELSSQTGRERERERSAVKNELELMDDFDEGMVDLGQIPGILSPAPANLPALPPAMFSPVAERFDVFFGFEDDLMSPFMLGNSASSAMFPAHDSTLEDQELEGGHLTPHRENRDTVSLFDKSEENSSAAGSAGIMLPKALDFMKSTCVLDSDQLLNDSVKEKIKDGLPKDRISEAMKDCCSIFFLLPEEYDVERDTLFQLWMAGGYVKDELMGHECFHYLLNEEYLSRSRTDFITGKDKYRINIKKIKDLLDDQRDNANFYFKWENIGCQKHTNSTQIQHVSLVCNDIDASIFETLQEYNELRTLLFLQNYGNNVSQIPDHLFQSFKELRALDLSRTNIKKLPSSVGCMICLCYLDLSGTLIEWLPDIICSLDELQTLKLRGCSKLRGLPRQLKRLTKLRHLDVDVFRQLSAIPKGLGDLVNLQTLSAFLVGTEEGCKIQELKEMNKLTGDFCIAMLENVGSADEAKEASLNKKQHINKLELRWTPSQLSRTDNNCFDVLDYLQPCSSLIELQIFCYEGSTLPDWVSDPKFNQLGSITFFKCEHISELPLLEQLPFLKQLELVKMNGVKKIERGGKPEQLAFSSLENLEIDEMQSLEVWSWVKRNEGDFKSLVELTIKDCPELQQFHVLPCLSAIKHLEIRECPKLESLSNMKLPDSLEDLIVEDCPRIKKKCSQQGEDWYKIRHVSNIRICVDDDDDEKDKDDDEDEC